MDSLCPIHTCTGKTHLGLCPMLQFSHCCRPSSRAHLSAIWWQLGLSRRLNISFLLQLGRVRWAHMPYLALKAGVACDHAGRFQCRLHASVA